VNQDEAMTASTPGELAKAAFNAASRNRNAKLTAAAVTPCSS
jgi:hypothetical protein